MRKLGLVSVFVVALVLVVLAGCSKSAESTESTVGTVESSSTERNWTYQTATGTEAERLREVTDMLLPLTETFSQTSSWNSTKRGILIETSEQNKQIFFETFTKDNVSCLTEDVEIYDFLYDGKEGVMLTWSGETLEFVLILSQEPKETVLITVV